MQGVDNENLFWWNSVENVIFHQFNIKIAVELDWKWNRMEHVRIRKLNEIEHNGKWNISHMFFKINTNRPILYLFSTFTHMWMNGKIYCGSCEMSKKLQRKEDLHEQLSSPDFRRDVFFKAINNKLQFFTYIHTHFDRLPCHSHELLIFNLYLQWKKSPRGRKNPLNFLDCHFSEIFFH